MAFGSLITKTTFFILFCQVVCAHDQRECGEERMLSENLRSAVNGIRFRRQENSSSSSCHVPDRDVLFYRSVFDLIPKENLTDVPVGTWVTLCDDFDQGDVGFVFKVLDLLKNDETRLIDFLTNVKIEFADNCSSCNCGCFSSRGGRNTLLQSVAADLVDTSVSEESALNLLLANHALLVAAPSYFLLKLANVHQILTSIYAAASVNSTTHFWTRQSPLTKTTWSKLVLQLQPKNRFASLIKGRTDYRFFQVLDTINATELEYIISTFDSAFLRSVNWNTVQIRKIVDLHKHDFPKPELCDNFLSRLLPVQIANLLIGRKADVDVDLDVKVNLTAAATKHIENVDEIALPQALQLFECAKALSTISSFPYCVWFHKLLYSQSNSFFSPLYDKPVPMKVIKCLDSYKYSVLQAHYILGRNKVLVDDVDRVLNIKGLMVAIPASFYHTLNPSSKLDRSLEIHFGHILKYFPSRANKMAALAAFHACKTALGYTECIASVLENEDNEVVYTLISPYHIWRFCDEIWKFVETKMMNDEPFKRRIAHFPSFVSTQLLRRENLVITYDQLVNKTNPIHLLILGGLDCQLLSRTPCSEFLSIFEFYNRQRKLYNKEFPKDLQKCAQRAFLRYLRTKSIIDVASASPFKLVHLDTDLLQYLDLADIRSIGGYVLATLPASSIAKCKYRRYIVEEIGRLSLGELLLTVTRSHLVSIASQYLKDTVKEERMRVEMQHLTTLGNLTHFLDDKYVRRIDASALRFLLQAEFIDTRICAFSSLRKTWADKLFETFGLPITWDENTLLRIGDMLIVLDESSFQALNVTATSRVIDSMKFKYTQFIEWIPRPLPFYQVCSATLAAQNEQLSYQSSVQRLALFYAESVQRLLDSIVSIADDYSATKLVDDIIERITIAPHSTEIDFSSATDDDDDDHEAGTSLAKTEYTATPTASFTPTPTPTPTTTTSEGRPAARGRDNEADVPSVTTFAFALDTYSSDVPWSSNNTDAVDQISKTTASATSFISHDTPTPTTMLFDATDYNASVVPFDAASTANLRGTFSTQRQTFTQNVETSFCSTVANSSPSSSSSSSSFFITTAADDHIQTTANTTPSPSDQHFPAASASASRATSTSTDMVTVSLSTTFDDEPEPSVTVASSPKTESTIRTDYDSHADKTTAAQHDDNDDEFYRRLLRYILKRTAAAAAAAPPSYSYQYRRAKRQSAAESGNEDETGTGTETKTKLLNVSCDTLKILDGIGISMADFILDSPRVRVNETDAFDCIELLARANKLSKKQKAAIWTNVRSKLSSENLTFVAGNVLSSVAQSHLADVTLDVRSAGGLELIDVLSRVWSDNNQPSRQFFKKILNDNVHLFEFNETNAAVFPVFRRALARIVCDVSNATFDWLFKSRDSNSNSETLDNFSFADVWTMFDGVVDCPMECLQRIANGALRVYGKPDEWSAVMFTALGPAVAAIPDLPRLLRQRPRIAAYFSTFAFQCLRQTKHFVRDDYRRHCDDDIPLKSAMLLLQDDCVSNDRRCSFTTSLAGIILTEDSLKLYPKPNSSRSTINSNSNSNFNSNTNSSRSAAAVNDNSKSSRSTSNSATTMFRPHWIFSSYLIAFTIIESFK